MDFIIVNGEIVKKHETGFFPVLWDEPFAVTQKFWFGYGGIPLFNENLATLKLTLTTLNIPFPELLKNENELFRITKRMLNKNRFYRSGIITCRVYHTQSGANMVISSVAFQNFEFPLSEQGLLLNFSEFEKYSGNPLNQFAFYNTPQWKFTQARNEGTPFQNSVFLNEKGTACDCISANLFVIKNKTLYTPSEITGCYIDNIRSHILETALEINLKVSESEEISTKDILLMNEVFIASEEQGIQWILGVENKRFVRQYSEKIHVHLNEKLKKMV